MQYRITVMPQKQNICAFAGENLLQVLRSAGIFVNTSCGGNSSCDQCKVLVDGKAVLACQTVVDQNMTVTLPAPKAEDIPTESISCNNGFSSASIPGFDHCSAQNVHCDTPESYWCREAVAFGFSKAVPLDVKTLQPRQDVRDMCAAGQCGAYGKNWTCPPYCGTLAECSSKLQQYDRGILLQTIGSTEKMIDTKAYRRTEAQHLAQFYQLCDALRRAYPNALCLGSGGCRICGKCAFPESCRFPEKACSSMEGYGLFVTEVCRKNELSYHYGERTITYTACILF